MPSPIGHALGGIAAGWLVEPCDTTPAAGRSRLPAFGFAALGIAADLDLLFGVHRGPTHSVGAIALVCLLIWLVLGPRPHRQRWAAAAAAAYGSHVLLDWLGSDTSAPIGVPAVWPFSSAYFQAPWTVFLAVSRRIQEPDLFWIPNIAAVVRELLILVPLMILVARWKSKSRGAASAFAVRTSSARLLDRSDRGHP
jgi:inner membrane protein